MNRKVFQGIKSLGVIDRRGKVLRGKQPGGKVPGGNSRGVMDGGN